MLPDLLPTVIPLRAFAFQCLFLLMAIAIEASILHHQMKMAPKTSVQYALTMNLLSTVLGWWAAFFAFNASQLLPSELKVALLGFIFFDQWSVGTTQLLILAGFITFFASFTVKQFAMMGLKWLLQDPPKPAAADAPSDLPAMVPPPVGSVFRKQQVRVVNPQIRTLLWANACSYSAILAALLFRLLVLNSLAL